MLATLAAVVLLFSYRTSLGPAAPKPTAAPKAAPKPADGTTYQGSVAPTRWGDVQVIITVADGRITAVSVPVYPNANHHDRQVNARALPVLTRETLAAQGVDIDTVTGATVTSGGYKESLQAAIDAAHLS
jgi:uncharacterized protein with FMN-binding domain